jgi:hypothetical protein
MRVDWLAVLELLTETFDVFSRRDCGWILAGYRPLPRRRVTSRMLRELERQRLIAPIVATAWDWQEINRRHRT